MNVGKENEKIFFPLALVTANSCIDNGKTINLICEDIKNIDALNSLFASGKEYDYYNRGLHETSVGTFFKYEVDDNKILLGEAGSYLSIDKSFGSTLYLMKIFLKNDFHNYFLTWRGGDGKYGGVVKTWNKTKEVFFIVFTVSIILTLIGFWISRKIEIIHEKKAFYFQKEINKLRSERKNLDVESGSIYSNIKDVRSQKNQLSSLIASNKKEEDIVTEDIESFCEEDKKQDLDIYKEKLDSVKATGKLHKEMYKEIEQKYIALQDQEEKTIKEYLELDGRFTELQGKQLDEVDKAGLAKLKKEWRVLNQKYNEILKLWEQSTKWTVRQNIESGVNDQGLVPFTLSVAFIAFEDYVNEYYKSIMDSSNYDEGARLSDKIYWIVKKGRLSSMENDFREVRIARNEWFHSGRSPKKGVIKKLLNIIKDQHPNI